MMMKWLEIGFASSYLVTIWTLVIVMTAKMSGLAKEKAPIAGLFRTAFFFLILGDTGLLVSRMVAFAMGGLEYSPAFLGGNIHLAGLGNLSTGITMTIFYVYVMEAWRRRFAKPLSGVYWAIIATVVIRFIFMSLPQNQWHSHVPPLDWSIYRNILVTIVGMGVALLIWRDAKKAGDRTFLWVAYMICVSYLCMWAFVVFYPAVPWIGVMMMVKTMAYIAIAFIAYGGLFKKDQPASTV
jgi:hypothetical protein